MKTRLLLWCCLLSLCIPNAWAQNKPTQILLISLDGISTYGLQTAKTPHIDQLLSEGCYTYTLRNVIPSMTLPNWTSLLCGSGPERHGVINNSWTTTSYSLAAVERDQDGYYPSIFKVLKEQIPGIKTSFYYNWSSLINAFNPAYIDELKFLANDTYVENFNRSFEFMKENRNSPFLTFMYDVHTDHAGHSHGWKSDNYITSIEEADTQIGILLSKLKAEGMYEDMYIFFLTDHGGTGTGHGGYTADEMSIPWGLVGQGIKVGELKEQNFNVNTASLIAHLFGAKQPGIWSGQPVDFVFDHPNPAILTSPTTDDTILYTIQSETYNGLLTATSSGTLVLNTANEASAQWYLTPATDGYHLSNKAFPGKVLGEIKGQPALVKSSDANAWYLIAHPGKVGTYSISQSANASEKCIHATAEGSVNYWTPSAFNHNGLLWILASDDERTAVNEKREELSEVIANARTILAKISERIDPKVVGSYRQETIDAFAAAIQEAQNAADNTTLDLNRLNTAITTIETAINHVNNAETVPFENNAVYRLKNADPRFSGKTFMYISTSGQMRWGVEQADIAENYKWKAVIESVKDGVTTVAFYNIGTGKYMGTSAWDNARPTTIKASDAKLLFRPDNSKGTDTREWVLRSTDAESVKNPGKSYLACTDDNSTNLTDGRILPWDPTDGTALHDGFWIFEKIEDGTDDDELQFAIRELKNQISTAEVLAAAMQEGIDNPIVGAYHDKEALSTLNTIIEKARSIVKSPTTAKDIQTATAELVSAQSKAEASGRIAFKDGSIYRIKNADPRFKGKVYLYCNNDGQVRWGIEQDNLKSNYLWQISVKEGCLLLKNYGLQKYLGTSAWNGSRPAQVSVGDTPVEYELGYMDKPYEWIMRSMDSHSATHPQNSFIACTGDNDQNLVDGLIRPWNITDSYAMHDAYWMFEEQIQPTGTNLPTTEEAEQLLVSNKSISIIPATPFAVYQTNGTQVSPESLTNGTYIVTTPKKSYKVLVY